MSPEGPQGSHKHPPTPWRASGATGPVVLGKIRRANAQFGFAGKLSGTALPGPPRVSAAFCYFAWSTLPEAVLQDREAICSSSGSSCSPSSLSSSAGSLILPARTAAREGTTKVLVSLWFLPSPQVARISHIYWPIRVSPSSATLCVPCPSSHSWLPGPPCTVTVSPWRMFCHPPGAPALSRTPGDWMPGHVVGRSVCLHVRSSDASTCRRETRALHVQNLCSL